MDKLVKLKEFFSNSKVKKATDYRKAIQEFGLVNDEVAQGLYGDERSSMLKDRNDLGIYQTPVQFANLLAFLETFDKIKSYCEIGIFRGGTFLFMKYFLQKMNPDIELTAIDPTDNIHALAKPEIEPYLIKGTSQDIKHKRFDLVFIDGDHSYGWCKADYENLGQYADICIFHDIVEPTCPGVVKFWNEIKQGKNFVEFTDTVGGGEHQGIGVLFQ